MEPVGLDCSKDQVKIWNLKNWRQKFLNQNFENPFHSFVCRPIGTRNMCAKFRENLIKTEGRVAIWRKFEDTQTDSQPPQSSLL